MIHLLNPDSSNEIYSFYADAFYALGVQFKWNANKDKLTSATFHLLDSQYEHEIIKLVVCNREPSHKYRLEVHLDYKGDSPKYVKAQHPISGITLDKYDTVQLAVVIYGPDQSYDPQYHCLSYGNHVPDTVKGGIVIKP